MLSRLAFRALARHGLRRLAYILLPLVGLASRWSRPDPKLDRVDRILVARLDLLGDVLFTRPLVTALRYQYPRAHITMLTLPYAAPLARLYDEVDEVVSVDTNRIRTVRGVLNPATWLQYRNTLRFLRSRRFDLGISVCGSTASLCVFLARARQTIGYEQEAYPGLLTNTLPGGRYQERMHEVDYVRRLTGAGFTPDDEEHLSVTVPASARDAITLLLLEAGIRESDTVVLVHAGAVNGSAKRWPPGSWARFIDQLEVRTRARVVLAGAESDLPIADEVRRRCSVPVASLVGRTSIEELIALIKRADLVATGDSGPLHLAVALKRPLLAVYGPTDPQIHGPYHPEAPVRLHRKELPCSPCYSMAATAECPLGDPICMRLVTVDQMVASAEDLLAEVSPLQR